MAELNLDRIFDDILQRPWQGVEPSQLVEKLADYAHRAWSGWMGYLFQKCVRNEDGHLIIPSWAEECWTRQMVTPYRDLSENEKNSDREEAFQMMMIIAPNCIHGLELFAAAAAKEGS